MPAVTEITDCQNSGDQMSLYYNLSGDCAIPVWVLHVGIIGDLNIGDTDDEKTLKRRGSGSIKKYIPGDTDIAITGTQIVQSSYQGFQVLQSARKGGTPKHLLVLTSPISVVGACGYAGQFYNFDRSISGPAEDEQEGSFNLKPAACVATACEVKAVRVAVSGTAADWDSLVLDT